MAYYTIRCNLTAANIPFATELQGRSIIYPQYDENYDYVLAATGVGDKDKGVPQIMFCQNAMPVEHGMQSVGYDTPIQPSLNATNFDKCFVLQLPSNNRYLYSPAQGLNYIYNGNTAQWTITSPFSPGVVDENTIVTLAFVSGQTYIYFANVGCYIYDDSANVMTLTTLTTLTATDVIGILASNGYMIAYDKVSASWSNISNATDFTPSLSTGAGGGSIQQRKGSILFGEAIAGGFLLYCEGNVVSARYTANINYPFTFQEVPGSAGYATPQRVSWQSNLAEHYVYGAAGMQAISKSDTENVFPELTDFLAAKIFEDFDETTLTLSRVYLSSQLDVNIKVISERYLVASYGVEPGIFTHAFVHDLYLKRWGKLKITHVDCFEFLSPNLYGAQTYDDLSPMTYDSLAGTTYDGLGINVNEPPLVKKTLAFLENTGKVQVVNFDVSEASADGVVILGKYQFMRTNWSTHMEGTVETVVPSNGFNYYVLPTTDGKTYLPAVPCMQVYQGPLTQTFKRRIPGQNFGILLTGAFNLTSVLVSFTNEYDR